MIAKVRSAALFGLDVLGVDVEVDLSNGLPGLAVVGLPDKSIDESKERVRSAIRSAGLELPPRRITVNLAPADVRKEGPAFDLPIAVGIAAASEQIPSPSERAVFVGELSLSGELKPVRGVLAVAMAARRTGHEVVYVPVGNAAEASLVKGLAVYAVETLGDLVTHLRDERRLMPYRRVEESIDESLGLLDMREVRGQLAAKRALEIAAAGGHNVMLSGPPGTGKTLLAKAMAGILPPLATMEMHEVSTIYSVAGLLPEAGLIRQRPFRSPHHSISLPGLIGGGSWPRPGEMTLAHRGVLFLDELPQFPSSVLEAMRGPLEDRIVRIARAQHTLQFPTDCLVVASENPCPCGFSSDPEISCICSPMTVERYTKRLSGPIRDRFDLTVEVPRLPFEQLAADGGERSTEIRERVCAARDRQRARFASETKLNATMTLKDLEAIIQVDGEAERLLAEAVGRMHLSIRGYHRVLKVAQTIADLEGSDVITEAAAAEALQYRRVGGAVAV